jgi:hypothetical protein
VTVLKIAFKEWAVVCKALAEGRQSIILRKGGIAESSGEFRPEHARFWLYPTFLHEHREGIKPTAQPLLDQAIADRPPAGLVRLSHFAEVAAIHRVLEWKQVEALDDLHVWSAEAVRAKFNYRTPGLYVLAVRVFKNSKSYDLAETAAYAGCKTWVELDRDLATDGATPVVAEQVFREAQAKIEGRLAK